MIDHEVIFRDVEEVPGRALRTTEGALPLDLRGTLIRNGPGRFHLGTDTVSFFDASGVVATVGFADGHAFLRARYVDTPLLREEAAAGRQVRRRVFSNLPRGGNAFNVALGNPAMHDAVFFGGRLHATDDGGWFRLDPATLATEGEDRWDGLVPKSGKMAPVPRVDRARRTLVTYHVAPDPLFGDKLVIVEFDEAWNKVAEVRHPLGVRLGVTHEIAFTERWYVVAELGVELSLLGALSGKGAPFSHLRRKPGRSARLHLVPRGAPAGRTGRVFEIDAGLEVLFHLANAHEDGEDVVVDGSAYAWADFAFFAPSSVRRPDARPGPKPSLRRFRLRPGESRTSGRVLCETAELPRIHPGWNGRPYAYAYAVANRTPGTEPDPFVWAHEVVKVDVRTGAVDAWNAGPTRFVSQPVFAPRPGGTDEDDGWVLVWLVDADRASAEIVVLGGRSLAAGPIAVLDAGGLLGLASHCRFEPDVVLGL